MATAVPRRGLWAWVAYDWAGNAFATVIQTFVFAAYFQHRVLGQDGDEAGGTGAWGLTLGLAGLLVALTGPLLGAIADRGGRRKPWLGAGTLLCGLAIAGLFFVEPERADVPLALLLVGIATYAAEGAMIFYNAMLPSLVPRRRLGRWSGIGWAAGYFGGLGCLVVVLVGFTPPDPLLPIPPEQSLPLRIAFVVTAAWYLVFALPLFLFTPDEPRRCGLRQAIGEGLAQIRSSLRRAREYADILRFLIARLVYTDGLATLFAFGGIYAAGTFGMREREILLFGIALNISAGCGAAAMALLTDRLGSKRTVVANLAALALCTSLLLTITDPLWFWIIGVTAGLFMGPVQAASRSLMSHLSPDHLRTEFFGLYAFSGKATAFLGPLLVAGLATLTGSQRLALIVIPLCLVGGLLLILTVPDPERHRN